MTESGFLSADSTLTAEDSYQWWAACVHELMVEQPATYTVEAFERGVRALIDLRPSDHPVRRMSVPPDFVFFSRLNLSMNAILSALNATFHTRGVLDDMDGVAEPVSELGKLHNAWVRSRGLPYGLDHRVQP
jgi:hypothetical protein